MTYSVKEMFYTLQGEGANAGRPAVFCRFAEDNVSVCKMLILAPPATPYARGAFVFDVLFPSEYPNAPPKVNLQTTGAGSVRFNPNLYNCGKVCLSLLGACPLVN